MPHDKRNPAVDSGGAPESSAVAGRHHKGSAPYVETALTTDDLKAAAVVAFRSNTYVRLCDDRRCVDVIPDVQLAEHLANGLPYRPTWLQVRSSRTFPGRVAYVYAAGAPEVAA